LPFDTHLFFLIYALFFTLSRTTIFVCYKILWQF